MKTIKVLLVDDQTIVRDGLRSLLSAHTMTYGASGYLLKDTGSDQLIQAIRDGMAGNIILPGRIATRITARLSQTQTKAVVPAAEAAGIDDFSARELDIIRLLTQGKSNREIADTLYLSTGTVKNCISQIYLKIGVNDRANAVLF